MGWYTQIGFYVPPGVVYDSKYGCFVDKNTGKWRKDVDKEWQLYNHQLRWKEEKENPPIHKNRKGEYDPNIPFFCQ